MITPVSRNILVRIDSVKKTAGGLHLPDGFQQDEKRKYVVAVKIGPKVEIAVQVGDLLVIRPGAPAVEVKDGSNEYLLVDESHVVAVRS